MNKFQTMSGKKEKFHWSHLQCLLLREEVNKHDVLVDPAKTNNTKIKEAAWEEVTKEVNHTFGLKLVCSQVRKNTMMTKK